LSSFNDRMTTPFALSGCHPLHVTISPSRLGNSTDSSIWRSSRSCWQVEGLAVALEELGDRGAGASLEVGVQVEEAPVEAGGE
jgi:hypothetical protein